MREGDSARSWPAVEGVVLLAVTFPLAVWLRVPTLWFVAPLALITLTQRSYADYGLCMTAGRISGSAEAQVLGHSTAWVF